jgi:serine/threonine-protein kinase
MEELTNREFGDYHIIRRIGSGATADVFLAEQRSLGRRVALKILKKELAAADETYTRRFTREARAIAALNHPNLVQIYQIDCRDGYWFIAQEYVQGETLQQEIQRSGALPAEKVLVLLWQIAAAFQTAAEAGIVHRDIKPENILLTANGTVKVTDFGLAHLQMSAIAKTDTALTEIGMTLGTPLYMSPEQSQGKPLDHRSDIYSLGITCWHALAGKPPFTGDTALSVALQHVNSPPPPLAKQRTGIPSALTAVIERMIAKNPEDRFQHFHEIIEQLQTAGLLPPHISVHRRSFVPASARQLLQQALHQKHSRFRRILIRLFFAVIIAIIGGVLGSTYQMWKRPPFLSAGALIVEKKQTAEEQWVYACVINTPEAWRCVIDYFPEENYFWGRKAKRQLIRFYYAETNTFDSLPLFQEFAVLSDVDIEDQMLGLAGLAWCAAENQNDVMAWNYLQRIKTAPADILFDQIYDAAKKAVQKRVETGGLPKPLK